MLRRSPSRIELQVVAAERSDTAEPVVVKIQPIGEIPQLRSNDRRG